MIRLLVIDDEQDMLDSLNKILKKHGQFDIQLINDGKKALQLITQGHYDGIICDLKMPEISGLDLLKKAGEAQPEAFFIMISGYGTIESSVEAMRLGASDFIEKPFSSKKLLSTLDAALQRHQPDKPKGSKTDNVELSFPDIIFKSQKMKNVLDMVMKVAVGEANIMITGESGTGKELIARNIHRLSRRTTSSFIPVNCAALPANLFESELFGHEKGAFTGASRTKPGLVEFADNGTFFLDEIGDLSLGLQVKLLRMLEERKIRRIGGQKEIPVNIRVISATNRDLENMVSENRFRQELLYRLNTINVHIPPLRERPEDIIVLAEHTLDDLVNREGKNIVSLSEEAMSALMKYHWPGNVRELQNMITRAYYMAQNAEIKLKDLPQMLYQQTEFLSENILELCYKDAKDKVMENFEQYYISHLLKKHKGNISKAAEQCGIDRRTIHRLIKKYDIFYND
ncbi:MAG: response regulator [Caldithrix sp.]|nr:response regulator [Caldithrix sp.]